FFDIFVNCFDVVFYCHLKNLHSVIIRPVISKKSTIKTNDKIIVTKVNKTVNLYIPLFIKSTKPKIKLPRQHKNQTTKREWSTLATTPNIADIIQ
ncbi:hypothetical protein ACI3RH_07535, partial [Lactococcus lactis]